MPDTASSLFRRGGKLDDAIEEDAHRMFPIPKSFFLTRGIGTHREQLTAFELALRDADIEQQNLVTVSSILPPKTTAST